jgi:hypothetical protein
MLNNIKVTDNDSEENESELLDNIKISYAHRVNQTKFQIKSLAEIVSVIRTSQQLKQAVEIIRIEKDSEKRRVLKNNSLPYINFGVFKGNKRLNINLESTEFILLDYDHLGDELLKAKEKLKKDKSVFMFFVSPSGDGLKVVYRLNEQLTDYNKFSDLYKYYAKQLGADLGADADKTSDASRACFLSYDPDIYVNVNADKLAVIDVKDDRVKNKTHNTKTDDKDDILGLLSGVGEGDRTNTATRIIGSFMHKGNSEATTLQWLILWNKNNTPPLDESKLDYMVKDMYKRYKTIPLAVNFIEKDNGYYKRSGDALKIVTSFTIKPKTLLVMDDSDCLTSDVESSQGYTYNDVMIENTDWHTKQKFLKSIGRSDCTFHGSESDLQALCQYIQQQVPVRKTGTKVIGLHNDTWVVESVNITKDGFSEEQSIIPYDKGEDAFYHKIKYSSVDNDEYKYVGGIIYDTILNINENDKILAYLGWLFATPVKPIIKNMGEGFPLLFHHGSQGSGKTSTAEMFMRMVGYNDINTSSCTTKTFPLLKALSSTNAIPQWYDEFKPTDMKDYETDNILRFMRKAYKGEVEAKGNADQTVTNYVLEAPMVVMGELAVHQPAIMERIIFIRGNDVVKKNKEMQHAFNRLKELNLEAFMPEYITFCLNQNIEDLFSDSIAFVKDHFKSLTVAPRIINNLSVMVLGLELFKMFAHNQNFIVPNINYELLLDTQLFELTGAKNGLVKSAVDQLIEELAVMAERREISEDYDYKILDINPDSITTRKCIAIRFTKVFPDFKMYAKRTNYEGDLLDKDSYMKMFSDTEYIVDKHRAIKFRDKTYRCLVLDTEKLIASGINIDGFGVV